MELKTKWDLGSFLVCESGDGTITCGKVIGIKVEKEGDKITIVYSIMANNARFCVNEDYLVEFIPVKEETNRLP
jgi:hypothetical protein